MSGSIGWFLAHLRMSRSQSRAAMDVGASTGASIRTSPLCRSTSTQPRSPTTSPDSISLFSRATPRGPSRRTRVPRARLVRLSRLDLRAFVASLGRVSVNHYRVEGLSVASIDVKLQALESSTAMLCFTVVRHRLNSFGPWAWVSHPRPCRATATPRTRAKATQDAATVTASQAWSWAAVVHEPDRIVEQTGVAMMPCRASRRSQWQPACQGPGTRRGTEIPCVHGATLLAFRTRNITGRQ